ncbi:2780_t:CDS:2 [Paraglomus brasilianum]|uniref:2780_t:CDS:1 n=1 Tax=Paraglomus brasilianum TaxID=144538 RepID=A0A9N9CJ73_9GLOM|nr:2780_t:CDS:2 [Paraglomus brasilianum]
MSIAIVYMAKEFNWSSTVAGLVFTAFLIGYLATQIIGGALADRFGGKIVLGTAAFAWSMFTLLTPLAAKHSLFSLILCRICLGIGEGAAFPSVHSLISAWIPQQEQTRAVSMTTAIAYSGSIIALPASSFLGSSVLGWESIFYVFGGVGLIWCMVCWLPTFYLDRFGIDVNKLGYFSVIPVIFQSIVGSSVGALSDYAIYKLNMRVVVVRKLAQAIGTLSIAISLLLATFVANTAAQGILIITVGTGLYGFVLAGLSVSLHDIAPLYAGTIFGLSNTIATVPAIFGLVLTGWILDVAGHQWEIVWVLTSAIYFIGIVVFIAWAGGEVVIE